jgi:tRNA threonylcarbamoyl adenosine modification protein YeaZ
MVYSLATDDCYKSWSDIQISISDQLDDINASKIHVILVNIGPGRFSGLRSSLAFAKGFARAKKIPIVPISSFDLIAHQVKREKFSVILDARKDQCYYKSYPKSQGIQLIDIANLDSEMLYGNIAPSTIVEINAQSMINYYRACKPNSVDPNDIEPLYIRQSV